MPLWAEFLHSLCSFPACVTSYFSPFPTCVCGWWSNMSIWISWVEVDGVLDILLFCTIDLTFGNLFSVSSALGWCPQAHLFFFSQEGDAGGVSGLDGRTMATAASLQPIALQTGAPGFLHHRRVRRVVQRHFRLLLSK